MSMKPDLKPAGVPAEGSMCLLPQKNACHVIQIGKPVCYVDILFRVPSLCKLQLGRTDSLVSCFQY